MQHSTTSITSPRSLAHKTLSALARGQYGNLAVDATLRRAEAAGLSDADRRLYTTLVYGVTERQTTLDFLVNRFSARPLGELDPAVLLALRLGMYQLAYLDRVPDHAAINETVALLPKQTRGYANAVLRAYLRFEASLGGRPRERALETPEAWAERFPELAGHPLTCLSVAYGVPEAMCRVFLDALGRAEGPAALAGFCRRPPVTLRVNTLRTTRDALLRELTDAGFDAAPGVYAPTAIRVSDGSLTALPAFLRGEFFVQDEASQLCVAALGARPEQVVVDVCACPGSKSFGTAIDMGNDGMIYDFDLHESKLSLIRTSAERLGISCVSVGARDARQPDPALAGKADCVLCDVPCSGLGVIAKKPEIRHKDLADSARLPSIQRDILEASAGYVKPGGRLVYSTCTLLPAENRDVVVAFLAAHPEFTPEDFVFMPTDAAHEHVRSEGGMATLLPHRHGTDGFFIARMRKKASEVSPHD